VGGGCHECKTGADCGTDTWGAHPGCNSSNNCICRVKDPGNVLTDSGFDSAGALASWGGGTKTNVAIGSDADHCRTSGSAHLQDGFDTIEQCATVSASKKYYFGFSAFNDGDLMGCGVYLYSDAACGTQVATAAIVMGNSTSATWALFHTSFTTASNAKSARVFCAPFNAGTGYVDEIYLNPNGDNF